MRNIAGIPILVPFKTFMKFNRWTNGEMRIASFTQVMACKDDWVQRLCLVHKASLAELLHSVGGHEMKVQREEYSQRWCNSECLLVNLETEETRLIRLARL